MNFFLNILTMMLCAGTMAYCYILSRQIKSLRNMREGVGLLIEDMIKTTQNLQTTFESTKKTMTYDYERLVDKIDEGVALTDYLNDLLLEARHVQKTIHKDDFYIPQTPIVSLPEVKKAQKATADQLNRIFNQNNISANAFGEDPLEDVVPKGLKLPNRKNPPSSIPGEEYL